MSNDVNAVKPIPALTALAFQGPPTQQPSISPLCKKATIFTGGTTTMSKSSSEISAEANQSLS